MPVCGQSTTAAAIAVGLESCASQSYCLVGAVASTSCSESASVQEFSESAGSEHVSTAGNTSTQPMSFIMCLLPFLCMLSSAGRMSFSIITYLLATAYFWFLEMPLFQLPKLLLSWAMLPYVQFVGWIVIDNPDAADTSFNGVY